MKIAQYMARTRLQEGGVVRVVLDLCGALAARGHDVVLLTIDPSDVPPPWLTGDPGMPRIERIERQLGWLPRLSRASTQQARREFERVDILHLHGPWDPICLQLARLARQSGVPYAVSLHGMLDEFPMGQKGAKKRVYLALAGRRFLEGAAAVHCTAEAEREQASKWYPRGRSVVVPCIFDLAPYLDLPGPELARRSFGDVFAGTGRPVVLFLSRLHPIKGVERLIHAAADLRRRGLDFAVAVAGTGEPSYEQRLRQLVNQVGISDRLHFLGFVAGRQKVSLFEAADLFVLLTSQENWGLVLTESLVCGTPVVTTKGVGIWPELQSSGAAVIVDPAPEAIASAVAELLGDPGRRRVMAQKGRAWALEHLNVDRVAGQYEQLYRRVCRAAC